MAEQSRAELPKGFDWRAITPEDSPKTPADVLADPQHADLSTAKLATGDAAFDFERPIRDFSDGTEKPGSGSFHLAEVAREKPVALIFGSYTWPPFRVQLEPLHSMWERYRDQVEFVVVYIREAHPEDGWVVSMNRDQDIAFDDPTSNDERDEAAAVCALGLEIRMPVVVDEIDDAIASAYGALPDRLYLIGKGGKVAFQGEPGPWGFKPEALEQAIQATIAN